MAKRKQDNVSAALPSLSAPADRQVLVQPLQTVALTPVTGVVTKRMLLAWLYCLKEIQRLPSARSYRRDMAGLMRYLETRDYREVKFDLRRMNVTQVEWNDYGPETERWGVTTLVAQAEIIREKQGNFIEITLPPRIDAGIRSRRQFSELSLLLARQIRSTSGLNLYRIAMAYQTNPSGLTFRATPQFWAPKLTGSPSEHDALASSRRPRNAAKRAPQPKFEYKYFKRDVLLPAVHEINALTDVRVELFEHYAGGRVAEIQFKVSRKEQPPPLLDAADGELEALAVEAATLGVTRQDLRKFARKFGTDQVRRNVKYTIERKQQHCSGLRDTRRYLTAAVRQDYAAGVDLEQAAADTKARDAKARRAQDRADEELVRHREGLRSERRQDAERMVREMGDGEQRAWWAKYLAHLEASGSALLLKSAKSKALKAALVKQSFFEWVADQSWGPINDNELLKYVIRSRRAA